MSSIPELLEGRRVCICAGSGGVGKTTIAAAVAMGMAARGLRVAVLTIDPARRLASSLGLAELSNEPRLIDPAHFAARGLAMEGELWAMMLDPKRTFDELIDHLAADSVAREAVLSNRIYRELSGAVAGSQEFTAIAKLHELHESGRWDLLVLDTPPTRHALDFIEAPDRLSDLFEGRALRLLVRPTGLGMRVLGRGTGLVLSVLGRVTGANLLDDLAGFFRALGSMLDGFRARAERVSALLADPATSFLLVTSAEREPIEEATWFWERLEAARLPFGGVIVNRLHHDALAPDADLAALGDELAAALGADLGGRVLETLHEYRGLAARDRVNLEHLEGRLGGHPMLLVPQLDEDIHDVAGLLAVHRYLFADAAERERMLATLEA